MAKKTLFFDVETFSAKEIYNLPPETFFRLGQYAWGRDGDVHITTDLEEMRSVIREADLVVAHNGINFDLPAVLGTDSTETLEMCLAGRVLDTMIWAMAVNPPPYSYKNRKGHTTYDAGDPKKARAWFSLDNQAFQFNVPGKIADLRELAKKYNEPKTKVADLKYELIPLDDPEFLEYAEQDVKTLQQVAVKLIDKTNREGHDWNYVYREMAIAGATNQVSLNGISIDEPVASARVQELLEEKNEILGWLQEEYDFPTEGKKPWQSKKGKEVIFNVLAEYGITEKTRPDWDRTDTGNLSLGGQTLLDITEGSEAERLGRALATLAGQRSLAELALDSMHDDGKAHPTILPIQRSKRWSVTEPGLTVWTKSREKEYIIASPGRKLVSMDYSNADARAVGAMSGDPLYNKRFELDENGNMPDGHELNGRAAFKAKYDEDPAHYRQLAKIFGHGWNYGGRAKTLSKQTGAPLEDAYEFVDGMDRAYTWLVAWQNDVRAEGKSGWVTNEWGGKLPVESGREFTQSPALLGQNATREILADGLLKMAERDIRLVTWVIGLIHDEVLADIPEEHLDWAVPAMVECLETTFEPKRYGYSTPIHFTVDSGDPAPNWYLATH